MEPARGASVQRFMPVGSGALLGIIAVLVFPRRTDSQAFFAVAAQVLPVLLLALAIEARLFGFALRDTDDDLARYLQEAAFALSGATVAVLLVGEVHALWMLGEGPGERASWPEYGALAWGFMTVGGLAILGTGRPRLSATVKWWQPPGSKNGVVVEAGASNEFGDKDVTPLMNLLVPDGLSIHRCDAHGNIDQRADLQVLTTDAESYAGVERWNYPAERVLLTAGDATIRYFLIGGLIPGRAYPLVLRYDHAQLPGGRVETEESIRIDTEQ